VPEELSTVEPALADQPSAVEWPTVQWPLGASSGEVDELVDVAFGDPKLHETYAVLVVAEGRIIAERYGGALPSFTHAPVPVDATTKLLSWSMAKSFLHAACGLLVDEGRLDPEAPAPIAAWREPGDPRGAITLRQLLQMRDGLDWREDYVDDRCSDVIEMLFGDAMPDVAAYAASRLLAHAPGSTFNYSSGTSNLIASIVGDVVGRGAPTEAFLVDRLFVPLGMGDATRDPGRTRDLHRLELPVLHRACHGEVRHAVPARRVLGGPTAAVGDVDGRRAAPDEPRCRSGHVLLAPLVARRSRYVLGKRLRGPTRRHRPRGQLAVRPLRPDAGR
jgi:CubicO group peptidase (beta-lactamase class C family)